MSPLFLSWLLDIILQLAKKLKGKQIHLNFLCLLIWLPKKARYAKNLHTNFGDNYKLETRPTYPLPYIIPIYLTLSRIFCGMVNYMGN